jgi:hypothetical protein
MPKISHLETPGLQRKGSSLPRVPRKELEPRPSVGHTCHIRESSLLPVDISGYVAHDLNGDAEPPPLGRSPKRTLSGSGTPPGVLFPDPKKTKSRCERSTEEIEAEVAKSKAEDRTKALELLALLTVRWQT